MRIENSFIPVRGVGEATERKLWANGATDWACFEASMVGPSTADNIESFIETARRHLEMGDSAFFDDAFPSSERWRLYENFRDEACFFDIETTGLNQEYHDVTTVSYHQAGETTTLVRGDDLTAEAVQQAVDDASLLVSFNGLRFDQPFLEAAFGIDVDCPHLDLMYPCKTLGLSGGLKTIEREIGLERDRPDISGRDAVRLWKQHESGVDGALDTLISYNREDAVNLETLAETVTDRLHERVFERACQESVD
ncbi:MAG: ribonuclease H-like domain-containing protein [Halohasta sp.]